MIEFEKGNPLRLDAVSLRNRVAFTYKQALLTLRYYPEMWCVSTTTVIIVVVVMVVDGVVCRQEYAESFEEKQCMDEAVQVYESAIEALPSCELMYFLYADFNERRRDFKVLLPPPHPLVMMVIMMASGIPSHLRRFGGKQHILPGDH